MAKSMTKSMTNHTQSTDTANTILAHMAAILKGLESIQPLLELGDLDTVVTKSNLVVDLQKKIKDTGVDIDALLENDQTFANQYYPLKANVLTLIDANTAAIKEWKINNSNKVTGSTEKIDQITKYFKSPQTSYFIDKHE